MRLSTKTRYGLRVMIDLAQHGGAGPVPLRDVAKRQGLSKKYLEQVVSPLVSAGLLRVARGQQGGYGLSRSPQLISCADVVSATEDGLSLLDCTAGPGACDRDGACPSQAVWRGLEQAIADYLGGISLQDVLDREADADMYVI